MTGEGFEVRLDGTDAGFRVGAGERILSAARRAGVWLPFECGWGSCTSCKATLVEGEVELLFSDAPAINERDARRRRILLCQSTPASDLVIRAQRVSELPTPERATRDVRARLAGVEPLGPSIARFSFVPIEADGGCAEVDYRPGQYALLELAPGLRRCYSMAGLPQDAELTFIAKEYDGPGSSALFALERGATLNLELPYGDMWLRPRDRPLLLAAGGTGISAILSLLRSLAAPGAEGRERRVRVVYGATTPGELVCWDELNALVAALPRATLHGALVAPEPEWVGTRGFVTHALVDLAASGEHDDLALSDAYLAGPPAMVSAVKAAFSDVGITLDRTYVDSFG